MSTYPCFWLDPTDEVEVSLRRYHGEHDSACCKTSGYGYHNATALMERGHRHSYPQVHGDVWPHHDHRWPATCSCGYIFADTDHWQFNPDGLYRCANNGELVTLENAPPGAMFNSYWHANDDLFRAGTDGVFLSVKLPDQTWWCVDGPGNRDGELVAGVWTRQGQIPRVSASPSIHIHGLNMPTTYHGHLTEGVLISTPDSPC